MASVRAKKVLMHLTTSFLALVLVCSLCPVAAFAQENPTESLPEEVPAGLPIANEAETNEEFQEEGSNALTQDENELSVVEPLEPEMIATKEGFQVSYQAHVAKIGWQEAVGDGIEAGTTGKSLAMEGLRIELGELAAQGSINYQAHVAKTGWQDWVSDGALAGTEGRALGIEAVRISLDGSVASSYDIYYRVHSASFGWLDWVCNGAPAGSVGFGKSVQAVEVILVPSGSAAPGPIGEGYKSKTISYQAHVQSIGWQSTVLEGEMAGTSGISKALEALRINVSGFDPDCLGGITYRAHVQSIGWQDWVSNGALAGTTGRSLRIEALEIKLTGDLATKYDVFYRAHSASFGWLSWASNGSTVGTSGCSLRMEAIEIILVERGIEPPPTDVTAPYRQLRYQYSANVQYVGWQSPVSGGVTAGTTGNARAVQQITAQINTLPVSGSVEYSTHVSTVGWTDYVSDGAVSGEEGKNIEAIRIKLTGDMALYFDIYYRAHSAQWGWMGWAKNGQNAGTTTCGLRLEAFEVRIVPRGSTAPGTTAHAYEESLPYTAAQQYMNARIKWLSSPTGWLIAIDSTNCMVGVYRGYAGNWTNVYFWDCAPGLSITPTVKGLYYVGSRGYSFGSGYTCYYWTQFYGDYLFHSVKYYQGTTIIKDGTLGAPASEGCIRLDIYNAKWIYDNIPSRTAVLSY